MAWYVMQTLTGGEEKLVSMIRKLIPSQLYGDCFVIYFEQLWRRQQQSLVHVERAFPGYVFIISDEPDKLYFSLKHVPAMSKIMAGDALHFLSLDPAETEFLSGIMNADHVIRLSYLSTDGHGRIFQISGPLKSCHDQVIRYNYRKRNVTVRLKLAGAEKQVRLGIVLNEDIRRELIYGKVEAPIAAAGQYSVLPSGEKCEGQAIFEPGENAVITGGELAGLSGTVLRARKHSVKLSVHFLGQSLEMEIPLEILQKSE